MSAFQALKAARDAGIRIDIDGDAINSATCKAVGQIAQNPAHGGVLAT